MLQVAALMKSLQGSALQEERADRSGNLSHGSEASRFSRQPAQALQFARNLNPSTSPSCKPPAHGEAAPPGEAVPLVVADGVPTGLGGAVGAGGGRVGGKQLLRLLAAGGVGVAEQRPVQVAVLQGGWEGRERGPRKDANGGFHTEAKAGCAALAQLVMNLKPDCNPSHAHTLVVALGQAQVVLDSHAAGPPTLACRGGVAGGEGTCAQSSPAGSQVHTLIGAAAVVHPPSRPHQACPYLQSGTWQ